MIARINGGELGPTEMLYTALSSVSTAVNSILNLHFCFNS